MPIFQGLSRDQQLEVARAARPTRVAAGEQVYAAGSAVAQLMVVHTGRVKISRISSDGHEQIVRVLGPGDFAGESAFLTGSRPDHGATAVEPGSMCVFRHRDLHRLVTAHPSIGMRMLHDDRVGKPALSAPLAHQQLDAARIRQDRHQRDAREFGGELWQVQRQAGAHHHIVRRA